MRIYFKKFGFIADDELRHQLELDYREVHSCMSNQAQKGAVVIAGGIVEAVLINRALVLPEEDKKRVKDMYRLLTKKDENIEKMNLYYLIKSLANLELISSPQSSRSDILREYRNLIHPYKKGKRPIKADAISVKKLLDDLIDEFNKNTILPSLTKTDKAILFLSHSKWKTKREKNEYREIINLLYGNQEVSFDELRQLPAFKDKENRSKSLIAHLNYLKDNNLCNYVASSWQGAPIKRYEKWSLNSKIRDKVKEYLKPGLED